jgi:hypothetical protein
MKLTLIDPVTRDEIKIPAKVGQGSSNDFTFLPIWGVDEDSETVGDIDIKNKCFTLYQVFVPNNFLLHKKLHKFLNRTLDPTPTSLPIFLKVEESTHENENGSWPFLVVNLSLTNSNFYGTEFILLIKQTTNFKFLELVSKSF